MCPDPDHSACPGETRRHFIKKTGMATAAVAGASLLPAAAFAREGQETVCLIFDPQDAIAKRAPVQWAAGELRDALVRRGIKADILDYSEAAPRSQSCILIASGASAHARGVLDEAKLTLPETPEAIAFARGWIGKMPRKVLLTGGSDERGLVYALLELADRVNFAADPIAALKAVKPTAEQPANAIRSVARAFVSDVEDKSWFQDRAFWPPYLTMLAAQRFNRFSLTLGIGYDFASGLRDCYFYFAYPFLLSVPGYNVSAVPLPDAERDRNLEMLRFISDETARRGLHFQLGLWTHAYQWTKSPDANYTIEGLTPETQAPYCRDALRALLTACPAISGVTFRVHGESGVPEGNYDLWKTIFDGVVQCGRRVEIDMHAKGMDQPMIDVALGTGMPVNISPKFWAEHMGLPYMQGAIRQQEMPRNTPNTGFFSRSSGSRSFLRYGYGDLLTEDRRYGVLHRIWPGTQRLLLWGDPETAAAYGRVSSFCGSQGVELFEPLFFKGRKGSGLPGGRNAYADPSLRPTGGDFEKYDYTYRVWGRNLYNPDGDADGWRRSLRHQFGGGAEKMEAALASASRILPLVTTAHCPSAANNNYWPEMYTNMAIVGLSPAQPYFDTPSPKRFGTVSPLDPEFFLGIDEYANELLGHEPSGKYSPAWVANQLEAAAETASARLRGARSKVRDTRSAGFRRLAVDVAIQAGLGRFFAAKFRAGVLYALYERSGYRPALESAINVHQMARVAWAELAGQARDVYVPDITFGPEFFQRGHWLDRLPAIDADTADMEKLLKQEPESGTAPLKVDRKVIEKAMHQALAKPEHGENPPLAGLHEPPPSFQRGRPLTIVAHVPKVSNVAMISGLRLRYRHVNQAEIWQMIEMERAGDDFRAVIAAVYTDSPFPLQYYFQIHSDSGHAWLRPGLERRWHGQPYFFVRQA
jgi:hypothetical protein